MIERKEWVSWFRDASPYINAQRGKTFVLALSGEALSHTNLENIIHDIALLNNLGVKLVIVFGARPQIDAALTAKGISQSFHLGLRVTCQASLPSVLEAYGKLRTELEAMLSMGVVNSPMHGSKIRVVSGNYVTAKPHGVLGGVDMQLTGKVRKIDTESIKAFLASSSIVLVPATGFSMSGEVFNLSYEELAAEVATSLHADKLIYLGDETGLVTDGNEQIAQLTVAQALQMASGRESCQLSDTQKSLLKSAAQACNAGVERAHLLGYSVDGALLGELFTRDGQGTMVSVDQFDQLRPARIEDTNGILQLIKPLEEQGYLVRRSKERIEMELDYFLVESRDNAIIACVGLYPFPDDQAAELSCFAVDPDYRQMGRGDRLLEKVTERAKALNLHKLFVLTTKTEHWFKERGFLNASIEDLPGSKDYNRDRNAKVLVKRI